MSTKLGINDGILGLKSHHRLELILLFGERTVVGFPSSTVLSFLRQRKFSLNILIQIDGLFRGKDCPLNSLVKEIVIHSDGFSFQEKKLAKQKHVNYIEFKFGTPTRHDRGVRIIFRCSYNVQYLIGSLCCLLKRFFLNKLASGHWFQ